MGTVKLSDVAFEPAVLGRYRIVDAIIWDKIQELNVKYDIECYEIELDKDWDGDLGSFMDKLGFLYEQTCIIKDEDKPLCEMLCDMAAHDVTMAKFFDFFKEEIKAMQEKSKIAQAT